MSKPFFPFTARAFAPVLIASIAAATFAADSDVVARIGSVEVKTSEIRDEIGKLDAIQQASLLKQPELLNQAVRTLLVRRLVLKEAKAKKWENQPAVAQALERLRDTAITESYLQSVSNPPADYPGDAELKAAYEANKASLVVPRQFQLAQIFIAVPKDADKAAADKAQARLDEVQKALKGRSAEFAELARANSDEKASAAKDGEIGWLAEAQIQPAIREKVADAAKNTVLAPLRLDDGWHIVKVLDIREQRTAAFDEVSGQLRQRMRAEKQRAASAEYINKLLKENPVAINELELSKLLQPAAK
jgi:parvulin-like peptidyl-prolyl isomerase